MQTYRATAKLPPSYASVSLSANLKTDHICLYLNIQKLSVLIHSEQAGVTLPPTLNSIDANGDEGKRNCKEGENEGVKKGSKQDRR